MSSSNRERGIPTAPDPKVVPSAEPAPGFPVVPDSYSNWLDRTQRARARHSAITQNLYSWANYKNWADRMKTTWEAEKKKLSRIASSGDSDDRRIRPCRITAGSWLVEPLDERQPLLDVFTHHVRLHLMHADAELRCAYVVLRIADGCDNRDSERLQKADERLVDARVALGAIGDDADALILAAHLRDQEEVADAARAGMDVDVRGAYRHQDFVRAAGDVRQLRSSKRRRCVDDHVGCRGGQAQLKAARRAPIVLESRHHLDRGLVCLTFLYPAQRCSLRI